MRIPIIPANAVHVAPAELQRVTELAKTLTQEIPALQCRHDSFRHLLVDRAIGDEPALHLDDFSEIPVIGESDNSVVLQQRARLRAAGGDLVALSKPIDRAFSDYCEHHLKLGKVEWLVPETEHALPRNVSQSQRQLALSCWRDREVRKDLIRATRQQGLRYIHPHVSTMHVWELAAFLHSATRRPISVIGPTPALARWANDKIEFTRTAARLLGNEFVPRTEIAYNFAVLSKTIAQLATTNARLGIKFPFGTGGCGNFLIDAAQIRGSSLADVREFLIRLLSGYRWPRSGRVLVDVWEQGVLRDGSKITSATCYTPGTLSLEVAMVGYEATVEVQMVNFYRSLSEKDRRRYAGVEAGKLGHGGVAYIARLFGCDPDTIRRGAEDVERLPEDSAEDRVRKKGRSKTS